MNIIFLYVNPDDINISPIFKENFLERNLEKENLITDVKIVDISPKDDAFC